MKFLLLITHNDLLELPTDVKVVERRIIEADKSKADALKKRFKRVFDAHGDGRDEFYEFQLIPLESVKPWCVEEADQWLDKFKKENADG